MSGSIYCSNCGGQIKDQTRHIRLVPVILCHHYNRFPENQYPIDSAPEFCPNCFRVAEPGIGICPICDRPCEIRD
jgi:hypothetical protein